MEYSWNPAGKGNALHGSDGSEWNVGTLPNGCTVLHGRDGYGSWLAACTIHGVLPLPEQHNSPHVSWRACMNHKPQEIT
jgi:hypothetical protein